MRDLARIAARDNAPLPPRYHRLFRVWFALGWPAFIAMVAIFALMICARACGDFTKEGDVSLAPLLNAHPIVQIHAFAALAAFALGLSQFASIKGTAPHRIRGWVWVILMGVVSLTAFGIHELRLWGPWSPIHLLAIFTLIMLPLAVLHARRQRIAQHRNAMIGIFVGALIIAGMFTFFPGRIMYRVAMGG